MQIRIILVEIVVVSALRQKTRPFSLLASLVRSCTRPLPTIILLIFEILVVILFLRRGVFLAHRLLLFILLQSLFGFSQLVLFISFEPFPFISILAGPFHIKKERFSLSFPFFFNVLLQVLLKLLDSDLFEALLSVGVISTARDLLDLY